MKKTMFAPLRQRNYGKIFLAQVLSDLGNWLDFIALNTLIVYVWDLGPEAVAALVITFALPWVLVGPIASVWIERVPKRMVMISSDLIRIAIVLGLYWAPNLYVLLPLVFLKGSCGAIFDPARHSAIRMIVPKESLPQAVSLSQFSVQSTKVIAPILGAVFVSMAGARSAFLVESVLFLLSALLLMTLPVLKPQPSDGEPTQEKESFWVQFRQGWAHVITNRLLFVATLSIMVGLFINFMYDGLFPLWTKHLHMDEKVFGMVLSAIGLGSVLGAVVIGQFAAWQKRPLAIMSIGAAIGGSQLLLMGLGGLEAIGGGVYLWFIVFLVLGMSSSAVFIPFGYIMQMETPQNLIGRVSATTNAVQNTTMLVSPSIGAFLAKIFGVGYVFFGSGLAMTLFGVSVLMVSFRISGGKSVKSSDKEGSVSA
ncbi:MFS transporter [Kroppenstedtia eburnea]|nr:MFS transporter [Kroppenstedtia eburnea]QKI81709.1 MFS transporter [Kroppenstedtia eburnea]